MYYHHSIPARFPKTFLLLAIVMIGALPALGQQNVAIAPVKLNVLYIGIDNPLQIAASEASDDQLTVSISGGESTISRKGKGLYHVRVSSVTDDCTITVLVKGKLAGTSKFRVRHLPRPAASVGGLNSGSIITAEKVMNQSGLGIFTNDTPVELNYEVLEYTVNVMDDKGHLKTILCQGAAFSPEAKQSMKNYLKAGEILTIEHIRVKDQEGKEMKLPALLYYIK
jgi:hypothetical protein